MTKPFRRPRKAARPAPAATAPDDRALIDAVVEAALAKKAERPEVLDLRGLSAFTDYFVIVSARNHPQVEAIVNSISEALQARNVTPSHVEGESAGDWILVDLGGVIVHVFMDEKRLFYDLEGLWRDAARVPVTSTGA